MNHHACASGGNGTIISVFKESEREFVRYLGGGDADTSKGDAWIARLVGPDQSSTMGGGVVIYERLTVDWDLPFDEMITLIDGTMRIISGGAAFDLVRGDVAWFPAHTPLTYEVNERAVVSYAIYPMPSKPVGA